MATGGRDGRADLGWLNEDDLNHGQRVRCAFDPTQILNPGEVFSLLRRCAELGRMHIHRGQLRSPTCHGFECRRCINGVAYSTNSMDDSEVNLIIGLAGIVATLIASDLGLYFTSKAGSRPLGEALFAKQLALITEVVHKQSRIRVFLTILRGDDEGP